MPSCVWREKIGKRPKTVYLRILQNFLPLVESVDLLITHSKEDSFLNKVRLVLSIFLAQANTYSASKLSHAQLCFNKTIQYTPIQKAAFLGSCERHRANAEARFFELRDMTRLVL